MISKLRSWIRSVFSGKQRPSPAAGAPPLGSGFESVRGAYTARGYHAVKVAQRDGMLGTSGSGREHERFDVRKLFDLSREYHRDMAAYRALEESWGVVTVGGGWIPQARSSNDGWNRQAEDWFRSFWKRPEARGDISGPCLERMVARDLFLTGEFALTKLKTRKLQFIDPEQITGQSPMETGIERDALGRPLSFGIAPYLEVGGLDLGRIQAIKAEDMIYGAEFGRASSYRGVPLLASTFPILWMIHDIFEAEAKARQLQSRFAVAITKEGSVFPSPTESADDPTKAAKDGDVAPRVQWFEAGLVMTGRPGEKISAVERSAPGPEFEKEILPFFRLVGAPIGFSMEFITLDWTKTNYSQSRAIIERTTAAAVRWQSKLEEFFYRPVYEWAIQGAIDAGELPPPPADDYLKHDWIKPAQPWIDPLKETQAHGEQIDRGFSTHGRVLASRHQDRDEFIAARKREVTEAIAAAKEVEQETGVKVPWQMFAGSKAEAPPPPAAAGPVKPGASPRGEQEPQEEETREEEAARE